MKFVEINYLLFLLGIENDTRKVCEFFLPAGYRFRYPFLLWGVRL